MGALVTYEKFISRERIESNVVQGVSRIKEPIGTCDMIAYRNGAELPLSTGAPVSPRPFFFRLPRTSQ